MYNKLFRTVFLASILSAFAVLVIFILTLAFGGTTDYPALFIGALFLMLLISAITLIISAFFSTKLTAEFSKKLNAIDPEHPSTDDSYKEISLLISRLSARNRLVERRLKEAVRQAEEFRLITENMNEGFLAIDEVGNILTYNSAAIKLLDINTTKPKNILDLSHNQSFRDIIFDVLSGNRAENEISLDAQTYNNIIANPVYDDNNVIGAIIIIIDITESFKREQLRREFTSNVSHELKTPLTSISGFAEIMKSGSTDAETVSDFSASIYDEAQRLITLVSDIIKLTELDEGSIEFEKETVDLYSLSAEILARLAPAAEKNSISLKLSGDRVNICGARKILDEMIFNLCDNAIKYNKPNGYVSVKIKADDENIRVSVCDNGIGIPHPEQHRVFERFYRVDKSHSREVGGTGLGLSIVKHGAIYHDARLELESSPGNGTCISITFKTNEKL